MSAIKQRLDHWDFIRGISMFAMFFLNAAGMNDWRPFGWEIDLNGMALVEPIIFLSGFLICLRTIPILSYAPLKETMKRFALRRIVRTWPMYYMVVLLCFAIPILPERSLNEPWWSYFTFTMNWKLETSNGLLGMWTLCVEEWCYAAFLLLIPFLRRDRNVTIFLLLALASILVRFAIVHASGPFPSVSLYMTNLKFPVWSHCDSFWFGCAFAEFYRRRQTPPFWVSLACLISSLLVLVVYFWTFNFLDPFWQITIPVWGAAFSALLIWGIEIIPPFWLRMTGMVHLGIISYTMYLWHRIIIAQFMSFNRIHEFLPVASWIESWATFAITCVISVGLFFLIEKWILEALRSVPALRMPRP